MNQGTTHTHLCTLEEMSDVAKSLSSRLTKGSCITFTGNLGAGKTTFISLLCSNLKVKDDISSPTFNYLNIYDDRIAHFDLYRLKKETEFFGLGFEEYLDGSYITLIEWPAIVEKLLPEKTIKIELKHKGNKRLVVINE